MRTEYHEHEIKILDVDIPKLERNLQNLGAIKVYDGTRTITTYDTADRHFLQEEDKLIRITEEGSIKVTMHVHQTYPDIKEGIKFKTSRLKETADFFHELGLDPICRVKAPRISYELGDIDFDIDSFPAIPPFLEIDTEYLAESGYTIEELLQRLDLADNQIVTMGSEDIHKLYNVDYFDIYKIPASIEI